MSDENEISYTKSKNGEGYLLRGPSGLKQGAIVDVTKKSGDTKQETVGEKVAGPFEDGICLYAIGGRKRASVAPAPTTCPHCGESLVAKDEEVPF